MYPILFLAISSFVCCLILTPLVRICFRRWGFLDHPNDTRKLHSSAVPRVGGIAIAASYLAALALLLAFPLPGAGAASLRFICQIMPAAGLIFAIGLLDDLIGLSPWQKLFGQTAAAALAYWTGVRILGIGGFSTNGWWSAPLTILWLVACANAFNLIDGVDGLATGIGLFATLTMFVAALLEHNTALALATVPLAGALRACLRYNFNPASIFLGDSGSLSIGFLLGCFGVIWTQKSATLLGMTAPLMALSIPLLDTGIAIARRFLRRQPIFSPDRNHIHHRLLARGFSPRMVALLLYSVGGVAAVFSLLQSRLQHKHGEVIMVLFCAAAWIGIRHLGYKEFDTLRRLLSQGTFRRVLNTQLYMEGFEEKLAAAATNEECWRLIREASHDQGFARVRLSLGGTTYEDSWDSVNLDSCCSMRIPLSDSDSEYVNFTCSGGSSRWSLVAMPALVDALQRSLGPRTHGFQTANVARQPVRSNGNSQSARATAASQPAVVMHGGSH